MFIDNSLYILSITFLVFLFLEPQYFDNASTSRIALREELEERNPVKGGGVLSRVPTQTQSAQYLR